MNIVILGAGDVGFSVARSLSQEGHDIVLIENDPERAAKAESEMDVMVVRGNGARPNVLEKAGITEGTGVNMLIACTSKDEVNILASWIAKRRGVKRVIARAVGLEFTDTGSWSRELGIDTMISPERSVARQITELLKTPGALHSAEIDDKAGVYAFRVEEGSPAAGSNLIELRSSNHKLITLIVCVDRGGDTFVPRATETLRVGDICYSFCYIDQINEIAQLYRPGKRRKLRSVMIAGAGKVGFQIAQLLASQRGVDVRLIDIDRDKCHKVASELPEAMVVLGDAADDTFLAEEGVASADGFVAATDSDERNLVLASLAKTMGAGKSIAAIRRESYRALDGRIPVDAIVNRNDTLSSVILSSVRYPDHAHSMMIFERMGAEAVQVDIPASSPAIGVELKDLKMPDDAVIGLVRCGPKKEIMIPTGGFKFAAGDRATIFSERGATDAVFDKLGIVKE